MWNSWLAQPTGDGLRNCTQGDAQGHCSSQGRFGYRKTWTPPGKSQVQDHAQAELSADLGTRLRDAAENPGAARDALPPAAPHHRPTSSGFPCLSAQASGDEGTAEFSPKRKHLSVQHCSLMGTEHSGREALLPWLGESWVDLRLKLDKNK